MQAPCTHLHKWSRSRLGSTLDRRRNQGLESDGEHATELGCPEAGRQDAPDMPRREIDSSPKLDEELSDGLY